MKGEEMLKIIKEVSIWLNKKIGNFTPEYLIITGSGLSNSIPDIEKVSSLQYSEIPHFPKTTVKGHKGELIFGKYGNKNIVIMRGRYHFYEGHSMSFISFPIRLLNFIGAKKLIVTAAVGSLKKEIKPGDIVILKDHINLMGSNPLIGNYAPEFGEMFVDMSEPYKKDLIGKLINIAKENNIPAHTGVYFAVSGPTYETESEVKMYSLLGGDVVGMSVVPEVISARQLKMDVCGITWVSNYTTGISTESFDHSKVLELGEKAGTKIKFLIEKVLSEGLL